MNSPKSCMRGHNGSHYSTGLRQLAIECLVPGSVMAEIGVYAGQSTLIFLNSGRVKTLWAIDPWRDNYDPQDPTCQLFSMAAVRKAFYENIAKFKNQVIVHEDFSINVAPLAPNHYFDLVYIDAKHQYKDVKEDILAWKDKVRPRGYIAGHDYTVWPGVGEAVREILGKPHKTFCDDSWAVQL